MWNWFGLRLIAGEVVCGFHPIRLHGTPAVHLSPASALGRRNLDCLGRFQELKILHSHPGVLVQKVIHLEAFA